MESMTKIICTAVSGIVTALVLGEVFANAVSRPIAAWRGPKIDKTRLIDLIDVMNQRICDLEDKKEEEAAE